MAESTSDSAYANMPFWVSPSSRAISVLIVRVMFLMFATFVRRAAVFRRSVNLPIAITEIIAMTATTRISSISVKPDFIFLSVMMGTLTCS